MGSKFLRGETRDERAAALYRLEGDGRMSIGSRSAHGVLPRPLPIRTMLPITRDNDGNHREARAA